MILKVGLTGGTASGKSTVARILAELGCLVIDADAIVHEMYRPGEPGFEAVVGHFGSEILSRNGTIDRQRLAEIAFASAQKTAELNALIHPLVIAWEKEWIAAQERRMAAEDRIVVVEATLLLESGGRDRYDRIVVVESPRHIQIERAVRRGMKRKDAEQRLRHQMDEAERQRMADYIIRNEGSEAQLAARTREVYAKLQHDLASKKKLLTADC